MSDIVEHVARAIAENGFGRPWDDFHAVNVHDTDQMDLEEYSAAAIRATIEHLRDNHSSTAWCALLDEIKVEQRFDGRFQVDGGTVTPAIKAFFDAVLAELPARLQEMEG